MRLLGLIFFVLLNSMFSVTFAKTIDLTHSFDNTTLYWPTVKPFHFEYTAERNKDEKFGFAMGKYSADEHVGTHLDAPYHFNEKGLKASEIPLEQLMGDGVLIDVTEQAKQNPDYLIKIEDFENWEKKHGKITENSIVLLYTGVSNDWPDRKKYTGTGKVGETALAEIHIPGLDGKAAEWLIKERNIKAIGIDSLSIDVANTKNFPSHRVLTADNIPIFENVANLSQLPKKGFQVIALPMKISEGTGVPLRIIAIE